MAQLFASLAVATLLATSACTDSDHVDEAIEFIRTPDPGCTAGPGWCDARLRLCDNGEMAAMLGDVLMTGDYRLDGHIVHAVGGGDFVFTFDLDTMRSPELTGEWTLAPSPGQLRCPQEHRDLED
jgi:hypothetical protein